MDDLLQLYELTDTYPRELEKLTEEWLIKLREILWGSSAAPTAAKEAVKDLTAASPQQTKKRVKRLASVNEEDVEEPAIAENTNNNKLSKGGNVSPRKSKRSNAQLLAAAEQIHVEEMVKEDASLPGERPLQAEATGAIADRKSEASNLMPPPPVPAPAEETHSGRPQRAAKLKSEKNLKEPKLNTKMRCPIDTSVKVKLEHEQRASQMHETASLQAAPAATVMPKASVSSAKSNDSIIILPAKKPSTVDISSTSEDEAIQKTADTVPKDKDPQQEKHDEESVSNESSEPNVRCLRIKIKREKVSLPSQEDKEGNAPSDDAIFKAPNSVPPPKVSTRSENITFEESSMASSILSSTANTSSATGKKTRKKKDAPPHRPIKVERFSDLDPKPSPVASRTRHGSTGKQLSQHEDDVDGATSAAVPEEVKSPGSIYEDAVETPPSRNSKGTSGNETVNLGPAPASDATMNLGPVPSDSTFCTNPAQTTFQVTPTQTTFVLEAGNPNATVTLSKNSGPIGDVTFEVYSSSKNDKDDEVAGQRSFETAKDSSMPHDDSLITEDESCEPTPPLPAKQKPPPPSAKSVSASAKAMGSAKAGYKIPARTNELFNPLAQSPVKLRVEAFENAAAAAATEQPKRPLRNKKENVTPTNTTTPIIGKLPAPALGRFLTPTQSSNVSSVGSAYAKKVVTSASKATSVLKTGNTTLQRSASNASTRTLQRENSADDFRKGLHNLAEERKKQREQKHLLAAQQREAKERERAERMAKLAKEREEKRLQKQQELQEQKKREMEEIQRKLRMQQEEEAAKLKAAREREMLLQMKQQQQAAAKQKMLPPPPKTTLKYTFEMLHEDDSTDDEDKVSYKRPQPPSWSRSHKRGPYVLKQEYTPSSYIDSFFSVQPLTPDLKQIFPNIDARYLKRNSSVLWSTPPRYSELPKY